MKRKNRDTPGIRIAQAIIAKYKPKSVAEMESYLGYEPNSREEKESTNRRNGYFDKTIKTSMGETETTCPTLKIKSGDVRA